YGEYQDIYRREVRHKIQLAFVENELVD
ncbi:MAG: hypothetical protein ACI85I_002810, partial [Arenicella sp.]